MSGQEITLTLNGKRRATPAHPGERLSAMLRERLEACDVKIGCDAGDCGACTVLVDGDPVCACLTPARRADGRKIETVTGLLERDPLAQALEARFLKGGAAQCGICTPGMMVSATALLRQNTDPTEDEIRDALGGVLCRCTGYRKILDAVHPGRGQRSDNQSDNITPDGPGHVGEAIPRLDGRGKTRGSERFGDDVAPPGTLAIRIIRCPHDHAGFSIGDTGKFVEKTPGIVAVLTAADVPGDPEFGVIPGFRDQPVFARDTARFRGEAVAAVIGEAGCMAEFDPASFPVAWTPRPAVNWNDSYPFVRLHQPSAFYGVNSAPLGDDTIDQVGWNKGLFELALGTEVVTYFEHVMERQFLPSGRAQYFPMCNYSGDRRFESLVSGEQFEVAATKVVDATYMNVKVPSVVGPSYDVADGVSCVALNELPTTSTPPDGYVIVGAGKTAMDAVLWLLANDVDPDTITWVTPRDSWIIDRANIQPGPDFWDAMLGNAAAQVQASAEARSVDDLFDRLETAGAVMRIDPGVRPTMYRCATCTRAELAQLRRVEKVVRLGRVRRIESDRVVLDEGEIATTPRTLHVNCAADGLERRPTVPVFDGDEITLQTVRHCQQVFSAALIAHLEVSYQDESTKNRLATVVPHPNTEIDWLRTALGNTLNAATWRKDEALSQWLASARLDGFSRTRAGGASSPEQQASMDLIAEHGPSSVANLQRLIAEAEGST